MFCVLVQLLCGNIGERFHSKRSFTELFKRQGKLRVMPSSPSEKGMQDLLSEQMKTKRLVIELKTFLLSV